MMIQDILSNAENTASVKLCALGFPDGKAAYKNLVLLSSGPFKGFLANIVDSALCSPSPGSALNNLEVISQNIPSGLIDEALKKPAFIERLITVCGSSLFLSNILSRHPDCFKWIFIENGLDEVKDTDVFRQELDERTKGITEFEHMARELRLFKQKEFLRIGSQDLLSITRVDEITRELSDLASASLDAAVDFSFRHCKALYGAPVYIDEDEETKEARFVVLGLGKLGGRELNFSSDIDIIYLYSSDKGETTGINGKPDSRISLHAFFVKLSMMVNKLISAVTGEGFVFRVDLDLRPEGRSGDMANSLRSAEIYYESWGQSWERAAMLKARPVAGSIKLGEEFLEMIRPFVFRRYLDFTAIEEIKSMKEKIDLSLLRRNPDAIDVKLGAGGIREIEFFCQALQLIHAGKDKEIRERTTLKALKKLTDKGYVKPQERDTLTKGYIFLRNLEHRIQIVEGRQSQVIPADPKALERLARMMGFKDTEDKKAGDFFWLEYKKVTNSVHEIYRSLFHRSEEENEVPEDILVLLSPDMTEEEATVRLIKLGFKDAVAAYRNISLLRSGPAFLHLSAKAQVILQKLAPRFLHRAAASPDPDKALFHLERFISSIGARTTFYSLLAENPRVLDELVKLFGTSLFLSRDLIEHPESLDILLSKELSIPYKAKAEIFEEFSREIEPKEDYEERLDTLRRLKNQEIFRIGINDIAGGLNSHQVSKQITFLAEAILEASYRIAIKELSRFGEPEGDAKFAILGLGKLGGKELIYGSDLDIIFVYSDTDGSTSGPKVISNQEYFVKLGQRIISALTLRTKEGYAFSVDARLRPSGSAGPLVVSRAALIKYHSGDTQIWERQAMIKARSTGGDIAFGCDIAKELEEIIYSKPLKKGDIEEMLRIRRRMETEIAKEDASRYNIKTGKGGLVDIEFLIQALQLYYGGEKKSLRTPYTMKALKRLAGGHIITEDERQFLKRAYAFYRLLEMRLRIVHDRPEGYLNIGSEELTTLARRAGYMGADANEKLLNDYKEYSGAVRESYLKMLETLKTEAK
ncbi:MAG: bifunctional [glutamate--ammonia ligase]-adenylyl-L-tyrosine phosphorylase/[glutamate--ammonia-ligase] adenylyltransferase [Deltaproteobacteria bacterium]|nr:bifunctional [glutamate--ammonia ligase]-adenylyl-L-tyrosine phosphorylase/[glutamate--ammonia-ligase] adenylyltransferase [Deltaproteobacteria bacterium]